MYFRPVHVSYSPPAANHGWWNRICDFVFSQENSYEWTQVRNTNVTHPLTLSKKTFSLDDYSQKNISLPFRALVTDHCSDEFLATWIVWTFSIDAATRFTGACVQSPDPSTFTIFSP